MHRLEDGSSWYPFGRSARGRLIYTPDGFMMVMLMNPDRPAAASGQLFEASAAERAAAAEGFLGYSGRCAFRGGQVVHEVDLSLFPNWVGSAQLRAYALEKDTVTFETRRFLANGRQQVASLTWSREVPAGLARKGGRKAQGKHRPDRPESS